MTNPIMKCPFCGDLYETHSHTIANQSCCPKCRNKAKENMQQYWRRNTKPSPGPGGARGDKLE